METVAVDCRVCGRHHETAVIEYDYGGTKLRLATCDTLPRDVVMSYGKVCIAAKNFEVSDKLLAQIATGVSGG